MEIAGILWLDQFVEKFAIKHHVAKQEVKEVLARKPRFWFVERGDRKGEDVYSATGQTEAGRYLIVFFVWKRDRRALVFSARDMSNWERKRYEKK